MALTAADVITTKVWLANGGIEANPFLSPVIEHLIPIKILFLIVMAVIVISVERTSRGDGWIPLASASVVTLVAVLNNILIVF